MRTLAALLVLACAGCNSDLRLEKRTWERYADQEVATRARFGRCREEAELSRIEEERKAATGRCSAAAAGAEGPPSAGGAVAGQGRRRDDPACLEEERLRALAFERFEQVKACAAEATRERDARRAELLQACQKCAPKDRCEKNLEGNLGVHWVSNYRPETPEGRARLEKAKAELGGRRLVFGCDR